jgi:hypothetical protein
MARKDLALGKLLTKDLEELGVAIDETAFCIEAASDVMQNYFQITIWSSSNSCAKLPV